MYDNKPNLHPDIPAPSRRFARFLTGLVGFLSGSILGGTAAVTACVALLQGTLYEAILLSALAAPVLGLIGGCAGIAMAFRCQRHLAALNAEGQGRRAQNRFKAFLVGGLLAAFAMMIDGISYAIAPPSDSALIANFERHRGELDTMVAMANTDKGLEIVGQYGTSPDNPATVHVSPERIATYRQLLKGSRIPGGFDVEKHQEGITFRAWVQGGASSSDKIKGYAYLPHPPQRLVASLDNSPFGQKGRFTYRHLQGNWYLYSEFIPEF